MMVTATLAPREVAERPRRRIEQSAARMHTTQAIVARLESGRGKRSTHRLERLAAATGMRLRIFFKPLAAP